MQNILLEMKAKGFEVEVEHLKLDGKVHRFGKGSKPNWLIGFQNFSRSGEMFHVVQYGSWATGETHTYHSDIKLTADDSAFMKKKISEAKIKEAEEKARVNQEVADSVSELWEKLSDSQIPEYLNKKRIPNLYGARSYRGELYVPMRDIDGKIWGVQRIQPDSKKFFQPGQRVTGCFHSIGTVDGSEIIYIAEGFSTGASVHLATGRPVFIAFNSGNLLPVAEAIRKKYPDKRIVICADNDQWVLKNGEPYNPGIYFAEQAAIKCQGTVIFPKFNSLETRPTDFNDLFLLEGINAVRDQIVEAKTKRHFVVPLGFREKEYFFTSSTNQQIVPIKSFSDVEFLNLMPKEYWEMTFPGMKGGIDWSGAKSELMSQCREKGIFEGERVRGSGVWLDQGRVIVNQGDHLLVNGIKTDISEIKSKYFYTLGRALPEVSNSPLSTDESELLVQICESFKWQRIEFGVFMAGAMVISKICGALPVRPHVWITGGSQTGKSTLLERLIWPTLNGYSLYFLGGTSEAGIRQNLKTDSIPMIFDEFETNGADSSQKIQACIELMRSAWSESHGVISKGSSGGNAVSYIPRFSAIVSSIRTNIQNDADRSRFTVVELAPHGSDQEHWKKLNQLLLKYDEKYINRLFARVLGMIPQILESYEVFRKVLAQKVGARFGQQYGMLLAGFWALKSDLAVTFDDARALVSMLNFEEESSSAKITDELELFQHLSTCKIRFGVDEKTIGQAIGEVIAHGPSSLNFILEQHGIRVIGDKVAIASNHYELRKLLKDTKWANNWAGTLSRLCGAEKNIPTRFTKIVLKSTKLPVSLFKQAEI